MKMGLLLNAMDESLSSIIYFSKTWLCLFKKTIQLTYHYATQSSFSFCHFVMLLKDATYDSLLYSLLVSVTTQ